MMLPLTFDKVLICAMMLPLLFDKAFTTAWSFLCIPEVSYVFLKYAYINYVYADMCCSLSRGCNRRRKAFAAEATILSL